MTKAEEPLMRFLGNGNYRESLVRGHSVWLLIWCIAHWEFRATNVQADLQCILNLGALKRTAIANRHRHTQISGIALPRDHSLAAPIAA